MWETRSQGGGLDRYFETTEPPPTDDPAIAALRTGAYVDVLLNGSESETEYVLELLREAEALDFQLGYNAYLESQRLNGQFDLVKAIDDLNANVVGPALSVLSIGTLATSFAPQARFAGGGLLDRASAAVRGFGAQVQGLVSRCVGGLTGRPVVAQPTPHPSGLQVTPKHDLIYRAQLRQARQLGRTQGVNVQRRAENLATRELEYRRQGLSRGRASARAARDFPERSFSQRIDDRRAQRAAAYYDKRATEEGVKRYRPSPRGAAHGFRSEAAQRRHFSGTAPRRRTRELGFSFSHTSPIHGRNVDLFSLAVAGGSGGDFDS